MFVAPKRISNSNNVSYKRWRSYIRKPEDKRCPWFSVEGPKQILELSNQIKIQLLLYCRMNPIIEVLMTRSVEVVRLEKTLLSTLSGVKTSQGIIAFFLKPSFTWNHITKFVLYLEDVQDPGNLGTLIRTAQATGLFSIVTSGKTVSPWNNKVVRAASGSLIQVPILENVKLDDLKKKKFCLVASSSDSSRSFFNQNFSSNTAFLIGNEGRGLTTQSINLADDVCGIPMEGSVDSLNLSVVGSLIMYQVYLQNLTYD